MDPGGTRMCAVHGVMVGRTTVAQEGRTDPGGSGMEKLGAALPG